VSGNVSAAVAASQNCQEMFRRCSPVWKSAGKRFRAPRHAGKVDGNIFGLLTTLESCREIFPRTEPRWKIARKYFRESNHAGKHHKNIPVSRWHRDCQSLLRT
jgi:hypothetical protein